MPVTRIGVQAVTGSPGQNVDIDPARITATIANVGGVAVEYSTGSTWTTIAAGATSASVSCNTADLRLRRAVSGAYPVAVDINWTAASEGESNSLTATQAQSLVSGVTIADTTENDASNATAVANQTAIQSAINTGNALVSGPAGSTVYHADTLIVPAGVRLAVAPGVRLQQSGPYGRVTSIRLGNVERSGSRGINGLMVIAHTAVATQETGTVRCVKSGGNYSFSYRGPGESAYGAAVVLTASGKATLISGAHVLLIRSALTSIPLVDGTYTQQITVVPSLMPARACTLARSGTTVTVTEVGHGRRSGDLAMVFGHGTGDGLFRITAVDADTYTYSDPTGSGTGAAYVYANSDVELSFGAGASLWSASSSAATTTDSMMMHLLLTNGLVITGGSFKNRGTAKYCGNIQGITRARINNPFFDETCSDGMTCQGAAFDVRIAGSSGGSLEDNLHGIGCTPSDFFAIHRPAEHGTNGVDGYSVQVTARNQVIEAVRIFGGKSNAGGLSARMDNIDLDISGNFTGSAGAWSIIQDTGTPALLDSVGMEVGRVNVRVNVVSLPDVFFPPGKMEAATAPNTVDDLTVSGSYVWNNTAAHGYSPAFFVHSSGTIKNFTGTAYITDLKAGGTQFAGVLSRKGGTVTRGTIRGGRVQGTTRVLSLDNGLAQSGVFSVEGVECSNVDFVCAGNSWVNAISFRDITGQVNTALYNNTAAAPATKCRISGAGELCVKSVNITGTGANASVNGSMLSVDGAKLAPNAGDVFYNTNAAFGAGVGLYGYGTAATRLAA